jgi:SAM-dependent methyltransferase
MTENPAATDWASDRGDKWSQQLAGMEAMLRPVDEPLIHALQIGGLRLNPPGRIADIGCGGGGTTLEIFRRALPGTIVRGFDLAPASIALARLRTTSQAPALSFEVADVTAVPPPAEPWDRLVSRFGIMFFDNPPAAFAALSRWLAPEGRFAFAVWGPLSENLWMTTVREVVGQVIDLPSSDLEAPGPFRYANAEKLLMLLAQAGFCDLEVTDWHGLLPIGGGLPARPAASFALAAFSSFGELLAKAGEASFNQALESLTQRFTACQQNGAVQLNASVHIVTGSSRA